MHPFGGLRLSHGHKISDALYEAVTELHLPLLEMTLEKHGYSIKEMSCYKHLVTQRN